jgi:hypothetical protein
MVCESGLGEKHLMSEADAVYVYSTVEDRPDLVGELVACRLCAEELCRGWRVLEATWSADEQGPILHIVHRSLRRRKGGQHTAS